MIDKEQFATKADLKEFKDEMISQMNEIFTRLVDYMDTRFDKLEQQVDGIEHDIKDLRSEFRISTDRIDNHETRIIRIENLVRNKKHA